MSQPSIIMIVEDEPDVLTIMRTLLRELTHGYEIVTISNGAEALAHMKRRRVALLLTDFNLPGLNGLDLLRQVRVLSPDTKIIMVTAFPSYDLEQKARAAGVSDFFPKPFPLDMLIEALKRALAGPDARSG